MHKGFLKTAAILAALAVALGALGAHKLKQMFSDDAVEVFKTGATYQFFHALALALAGILYAAFPNKFLKAAGVLFLAGIILFSGSLYILTYKLGTVNSGLNWVGPITPVGGACFIIGWICLALGIKSNKV